MKITYFEKFISTRITYGVDVSDYIMNSKSVVKCNEILALKKFTQLLFSVFVIFLRIWSFHITLYVLILFIY